MRPWRAMGELFMAEKVYVLNPGTEQERRVALKPLDNHRFSVTLGEGEDTKQVEIEAHQLGDGTWSLSQDAAFYEVNTAARDDLWEVQVRGSRHLHTVMSERQLRMLEASGGSAGANTPELKTPMAGKIIAVLVEPGQAVEVGDKVVVVEAMKMENELKAHHAGLISQIQVKAEDTVEVGAVLLHIEDPD